jgi:hypothetical protein
LDRSKRMSMSGIMGEKVPAEEWGKVGLEVVEKGIQGSDNENV